ncbi:MAG: phenylalanine--tRNA ligase subunit beta [Methanobacteriota archaeon]|nr:MAG: phenylalanine--tRNA ligase subunit beta [Euryarchaeota archaeon]
MPVINFSHSDLCNLVGRDIDIDTLRVRLPMIGADLNVAEEGDDELSFEFFPDRPDLFSVEGIARALKAFLDIEPGLRDYTATPSGVTVAVDESVDEVRPFIWSAVVEGLTIDDPLIRSIMDLQEKLHLTLGRDRRKVAIGIHDIEGVKPPFRYTTVQPDGMSFFPLQGTREMTPAEILREHEKGKAYSFVLEGKSRYPIILDKDDTVLSMPPVINGIATEVTERTDTVFVDCTGTDINALRYAVNIMTAALADRGGGVRAVAIERDGASPETAPDLSPSRMKLDVAYSNRWLGTSLSAEEMSACLERMGHGVSAEGESLDVSVPCYRADVLHPVDLVEDVAIGFGYEKFGNTMPRALTYGVEDPLIAFANRVRPMLVGLGYFEVATLSLSNDEEQFRALNMEEDPEALRIRNPATEAHTLVRTSLIPSLLGILRRNKHRELPQRVFEIGDVVLRKRNRKRMAAVAIHAKASFTECKSLALSISAAMGLTTDVVPTNCPSYIPGRCAALRVGGEDVGVFGELHPATAEAFELKYPLIGLEVDLEALMPAVEDRGS